MKWLIIYATVVFSGVLASDDESHPVVEIKQGKLQGLRGVSRTGNAYFAFLGIPYGKAPERFGLPQEADSWSGVRMAINHAPQCAQFCIMQGSVCGAESSCLTLNIYTRKLDGNLPVIVLIHGGGFQFGSGSFCEEKYFMDEDVVLVTIQYRLGALGFLNTEDDVAQGNMGLKDQSFALKWTQTNIDKFGGDPKMVTILGYSSGGSSVHYQMLSPMSKGLFSHAISQSGSALNPWAFQSRPRELTNRLAALLGCSTDTSKVMVECLKTKTPTEIVTAQLKLSSLPPEFNLMSMLFVPSIERGSKSPKFLSETPYWIITNDKTESKVPWIIGLTPEEGAFFTANILESPKSLEKLDSDWFNMLPSMLYFENSASLATQRIVAEKVKHYYFPDGKITKEDYLKVGQLFGDRFFVVGVTRAIKEYAKKPQLPVYPYIFNYTGSHSIVEGMLHASKSYGVAHTDELQYMFNQSFLSPEYGLDSDEGKFSQKFLKLLVSFARDGKPTETWGSAKAWEQLSLYKGDDVENPLPIPWYVIDEDTKILGEDIFKNRTDFWESLPLREMEKDA